MSKRHRKDSARLEGAKRTSQKARSRANKNSSLPQPTGSDESCTGVPHREHFRERPKTIVIASAVVLILFSFFSFQTSTPDVNGETSP